MCLVVVYYNYVENIAIYLVGNCPDWIANSKNKEGGAIILEKILRRNMVVKLLRQNVLL